MSISGIWSILQRLGVRYKRGRDYCHSPDLHYVEKCRLLEQARAKVAAEPERYVLLYLDEFSFYRQPTLANDWETVGLAQPLARRSYAPDTRCRGIGALNALTGQLTYALRSKISLPVLKQFYQQLHGDYPAAEQLYVAVDNWPVHFHPQVMAALVPQTLPYPPKLPASWANLPTPPPAENPLPIHLLCLPTYAPWLNPIEKLWRWLRQTVLHLHRLSDDWATLKQRVDDFFNQFRDGSRDLLHYVGLLGT